MHRASSCDKMVCPCPGIAHDAVRDHGGPVSALPVGACSARQNPASTPEAVRESRRTGHGDDRLRSPLPRGRAPQRRGPAMITMMRDSSPPSRLSTGIDQLDAILGGGIPRYSTVIVSGLPGTGKTILSQQAAFANAQAGRTCLYLNTISEPPLKMLRFLQDFTFFHPDLFETKVLYSDLGRALRTEGPAGLLAQLDHLVRAHRPELVVMDGFKAVRDFIRDPVAFRAFTVDVVVQLTAWEVTALLVGEYTPEDVREGAEFAIADGIIYLSGREEVEKQKRCLRVLKMRGTAFLDGEHFFEISAAGITPYPPPPPPPVGGD